MKKHEEAAGVVADDASMEVEVENTTGDGLTWLDEHGSRQTSDDCRPENKTAQITPLVGFLASGLAARECF